LSSRLAELLARIARLRKQQKFLNKRGSSMLEHDTLVMENLDRENPPSPEGLAELERLANESEARQLSSSPALPPVVRQSNQ